MPKRSEGETGTYYENMVKDPKVDTVTRTGNCI